MKLVLGLMLLVASINVMAASNCSMSNLAGCTTQADCTALNAGASPAVVAWNVSCVKVEASQVANPPCDVASTAARDGEVKADGKGDGKSDKSSAAAK